jgi:diguanylate cyclase (GGDEF)-like protein
LLLAILILFSMLTSTIKVSFPRSTSTLTFCQVLDYLALLLVGTPGAVLVAGAGAWGQCTFRNRYPNPTHQTLFSISCLAIAVHMAGTLYVRLGGRLWDPLGAIVPFSGAASVFFVINSALVAGAIAVTTGQSAVRLWLETFAWSWPSYLLGAAVAVAATVGLQQGGFWSVVFLAIPLALTLQNLRAYRDRFNDAVTDPLTSLANQRVILPHAAREVARALRRRSPLAVILVDVDDFKSINDMYGHRAGDLALQHIARCLEQSIRLQDVCARYAGDEFLLVLPGCDGAAAGRKAAELQAALAATRLELRPGLEIRLAISAGTAVVPEDGGALEQLVEIADARMYRNKFGARSNPSSRMRENPADSQHDQLHAV